MFQKLMLENRCWNVFLNKELADYIHSLGGIFRTDWLWMKLQSSSSICYFQVDYCNSVYSGCQLYFEMPPADLS